MRESAPWLNPSICANVVRAIGPYWAMAAATRCVCSDPENHCGIALASDMLKPLCIIYCVNHKIPRFLFLAQVGSLALGMKWRNRYF